MNPEKARGLFSEYREGTLSPTLREAVETALGGDPGLSQEYKSFCELLDELEGTRSRTVEAPYDLHERIMARVDKSVFENQRQAKTGWLSGWRLALVGAVATLVVVGSLKSMNNVGQGPDTGSVITTDGEQGLRLSTKDGSLYVQHGAAQGASVLVKEFETEKLVERFDLNGKRLDSLLNNDGDSAVLLKVESSTGSEGTVIVVAVPGQRAHTELKGKGTCAAMAIAAAETFREPVLVEIKDVQASVDWTFDTSDATRSKTVAGQVRFERRSGLLYLVD
jgi:hypothetical protein